MSSVFAKLPQFEISQVEKVGSFIKYSGLLKNTSTFAKAKPGWVVVICLESNRFLEGRFSVINSSTFQAVIDVSDEHVPISLVVGNEYPLLAGYWGILAELVLNDSTIWKKIKFEPHDSTVRYPDGRVKIVKDGWDHEHCRICFQTISSVEVDNEDGYVNEEGDWLCKSCYQNYVVKRSLGFINLGQMF
jgi:hypothetical protein